MPRERKVILASLSNKGFTLEDGRDHYILRLLYKGRKTGVFTKISRGTDYKDYSDSLLAKVCRQLRVTRSQLNDLIDCDMDGPTYASVLLGAGVIEESPPKTLPKTSK